MTEPDEVERVRAAKIAAMQRLVDEARANGHCDKTMEDVRREAKELLRARMIGGSADGYLLTDKGDRSEDPEE